jgi:hypothetical protein
MRNADICDGNLFTSSIRIYGLETMIKNTTKFRDFGGIRLGNGGWVRADKLYRSGDFGKLRPIDFEALLALDFEL